MGDTTEPFAVAMLDVLGFSNFLRRSGLGATDLLYERLLAFVDTQTGGLDIVHLPAGKDRVRPAVGWFLPEHTYFSDTILFWVPYSPIALSRLAEVTAEALCISVELGLPLRGAIAIGNAVLDNNSRRYLGEPLIEAAESEKAQEWIGASFGPSILEGSNGQGLLMHAFLPFRSHVKSGYEGVVPGLVVDWPRRWRESREADAVAAVRGLDVDPQYRRYYDNTERFIRFSLENHDWFTNQPHLGFG